MELPKHTCISCAYLCEQADGYWGIAQRRMSLDDKRQGLVGADYIYLVCYKGRLPSFYISGKTAEEIRTIITTPNTCKQWTQFINGVSPIATEQRQSSKWAKRAFLVAFVTLAVVLVTWILTQFVLNQSTPP